MNSKELVRRTIHFQGPERLPFTGSMGETDFSPLDTLPGHGRLPAVLCQ